MRAAFPLSPAVTPIATANCNCPAFPAVLRVGRRHDVPQRSAAQTFIDNDDLAESDDQ